MLSVLFAADGCLSVVWCRAGTAVSCIRDSCAGERTGQYGLGKVLLLQGWSLGRLVACVCLSHQLGAVSWLPIALCTSPVGRKLCVVQHLHVTMILHLYNMPERSLGSLHVCSAAVEGEASAA